MNPVDRAASFFGSIEDVDWSSFDDPGHRVASALRRLAAQALAGAPDDVTLAQLADRLETIAPGTVAEGSRYRDQDRSAPDRSRRLRPNGNGTHPLAGPRNPVAPPIALSLGENRVFGDVTYDVRFEGLPGLVQGGFVAAGFDLMLGQGIAMAGHGGMTGTLSVRFLAPTPLYELLRYEAWFARREGRKGFAAAHLVVVQSGARCAEAEGVFITPKGAGS
ncbi:MAG TPA: PaaI family thioesterase [Acidimicrobiales bacterium]|nr:PaaI family thioesterase [Acidimicrobiales bacterium]